MNKLIITTTCLILTACSTSPSHTPNSADSVSNSETQKSTTVSVHSQSSNNTVETFNCTLDATKTRGWVPESFFITFNSGNPVIMMSTSYDYDMDKVKTLRFNEDFKEVKYRGSFVDSSNASVATTHTITIMPKKDNKIIYNFKFDHYSNGYSARGTCN